MIIIPHAVASALISICFERLRAPRPERWSRAMVVTIVCAASFCSHFLLDALPHYDYRIYGPNKMENAVKIFFDFAFAMTLVIFIFKKQFRDLKTWASYPGKIRSLPSAKEKLASLPVVLTVLAGIAFSLLPDILIVISHTTHALENYKKFHDAFHGQVSLKIEWGVICQIITVLILLFLAQKRREKMDYELELAAKINSRIKEINGEMPIYFGKKK